MFYNLVREYTDIIANYQVTDFKQFASARSLVAQITFSDQSVLYIKDYLFLDGTRKYSYHWQTLNRQLRVRWDNSPHHTHIVTFPHHKHEAGEVFASHERELQDILEYIRNLLLSTCKDEETPS